MVRSFTRHDLSCFKLVLLCLACIVFSEPSIHCANCDILKSYSTIDRRSNADHILGICPQALQLSYIIT